MYNYLRDLCYIGKQHCQRKMSGIELLFRQRLQKNKMNFVLTSHSTVPMTHQRVVNDGDDKRQHETRLT